MPESIDTLLDDLTALRRRLLAGHEAMVARVGDRDWEHKADARWDRLAAHYLAMIEGVPLDARASLTAESDKLAARLAKGWLMEPSDRVPEDAILEQFEALLARYEACEDAIQGVAYVRRWLIARQGYVHLARRQKRKAVVA